MNKENELFCNSCDDYLDCKFAKSRKNSICLDYVKTTILKKNNKKVATLKENSPQQKLSDKIIKNTE